MNLSDSKYSMDYYDCGFTNAMSSNLASVRTTNDYSTENECVISPKPTTLREIDFLEYRISELEKTVERMKEMFELMNMKIN